MKKSCKKTTESQSTTPVRKSNRCPLCHQVAVHTETLMPSIVIGEDGRRVFDGAVTYAHYCEHEHRWETK